MKRNIYSYSKLWMILFVLMGAACTNQVEDAIPVSGQPIEFSVQSDWKEIPNTRLNDGKTYFEAGNKIQIFGFHRSSSGVKKFMYRVNEPTRGTALFSQRKQSQFPCFVYSLCSICRIKLLHYSAAVEFHGIHRDVELFGNISGRFAAGCNPQYFSLALRQHIR